MPEMEYGIELNLQKQAFKKMIYTFNHKIRAEVDVKLDILIRTKYDTNLLEEVFDDLMGTYQATCAMDGNIKPTAKDKCLHSLYTHIMELYAGRTRGNCKDLETGRSWASLKNTCRSYYYETRIHEYILEIFKEKLLERRLTSTIDPISKFNIGVINRYLHLSDTRLSEHIKNEVLQLKVIDHLNRLYPVRFDVLLQKVSEEDLQHFIYRAPTLSWSYGRSSVRRAREPDTLSMRIKCE